MSSFKDGENVANASYRNRIVPYRQFCIFKRMDESARSHLDRPRDAELLVHGFALILLVACCQLAGPGLGQDRHRAWAWKKFVWPFPTSSRQRGSAKYRAAARLSTTHCGTISTSPASLNWSRRAFIRLQVPAQPAEVNFIAWNSPPPNAAMLAFGNSGRGRRKADGSRLAV